MSGMSLRSATFPMCSLSLGLVPSLHQVPGRVYGAEDTGVNKILVDGNPGPGGADIQAINT